MKSAKDYIRGGTQKEKYSSAEVEEVSCPLCVSNRKKIIYTERGVLGIVQCLQCGMIYVSPRLKSPEEIYHGDGKIYFEEARLIFLGQATHHRDPNYMNDLKLIKKYKPSGRLLDIGTNMGLFLRKARNAKWDLYGVEPSPSLSELARKYFGLNVKTAYLANAGFEDKFFDIITMTDVFEHIVDPKTMLKEIRRILKPDGIVFVKVPNARFNLLKLKILKLLNRLSEHDIFDSYEHVVHYSCDTLKTMLEANGFKVAKVSIGTPIQIPAWHNYVGHYYVYPSPWFMDAKKSILRLVFYYFSKIERFARFGNIGYLAPNIIMIARNKEE